MNRTWTRHYGKLLTSKNGFDVINCDHCGFNHTIPIPTEAELEKIYKDEYYTNEKPLYIERMQEDKEWWDLAYNDRYETFELNLPEKRRKILDVGSGPGYFLNSGIQRGWDVTGIEPSLQAFEYSTKELGLTILNFYLNDSTKDQIGRYDVIHMSEVLEHIPDPLKLIQIVFEKLTSGGLICIVVPNDYNPFQLSLEKFNGFEPWWVAPPHHINYFSFNSIRNLLSRTGFKIIQKESTFPIDLFLLMGKNYIGNDKIGRDCHQLRKNFELNMAKSGANTLKRQLYEKLADLNIGREILITAKKP